jgi:hypothetical protein
MPYTQGPPSGWFERFLSWLFKQEDIGENATLYMRRWRIAGYNATLPTIFGRNLMLHKMVRPDGDPDPHDHPWDFWSLVVWGGYVEHVYNMVAKEVHREPRHFPWHVHRKLLALDFRDATHMHRVHTLFKGVSWTLVMTSGRQREWGFWTDKGWVHWKQYKSVK